MAFLPRCLAVLLLLGNTTAFHANRLFQQFDTASRPPRSGPPTKRDGGSMAPLKITNNCGETLWPGIGTQAGTGPGIGGFELAPGEGVDLMVSANWQGRVWGRTNCSFNAAGTGPADGEGPSCDSGDCQGVLDCVATGVSPATLAEYDLAGGNGNRQCFYDISLVDGYNLPLGIVMLPGSDPKLADVPPNLTNAVCIATAGYAAPPAPSGQNGGSGNTSFPIPWEPIQGNAQIASWCPWDLLTIQPDKPGDGVYPYPDDHIKRPTFDPCGSGCAKTNSPQDCCTGEYSDRAKCVPNMYSHQSNKVCPDAYGFPFDDESSTFVIPGGGGGGFETIFCPEGRSSNILKTFKQQLQDLTSASPAKLGEIMQDAGNLTIIMEAAKKMSRGERSRGELGDMGSVGALVVVIAWLVLS
ncbi:thaumatin family-domain-containing protein [Amylocarpus encephaloides]|uniref:Thaumatin family-domain-containing protein n=1 Tax=Amylocarpus encephaloides TaxID=45428 RepID=A0A9P8C5S5_9HELO|nr:thaumatin family-domain-containing protein [Amylocarpus encephaloides]